jgi:hypothetical protein
VIWGRALDPDSLPLEQAVVLLDDDFCGTLSDSLGRFAFSGVPDGDHLLKAQYIGYADDSLRIVVVSDTSHVEFSLWFPSRRWTLEPPRDGVDRRSIDEDRVPRVLGCYDIELLEPYGSPIGENDSPWRDPPDWYRGIPTKVAMDTVRDRGHTLTLKGDTPGLGVLRNSWGFAVQGDTIWASWQGGGPWSIKYRLIRRGDNLVGQSQYISDAVLWGTEPRETRWLRTPCKGFHTSGSVKLGTENAG